MARRQHNYSKPLELPSEGSSGFKALCGLAGYLGYDTDPKQLYNDDSTTVSSVINMLEDNPGMISAIYQFVEENRDAYDALSSEEEDEEEDDDSVDASV